MTRIEFSDGEYFETSGSLRAIHRRDGWYVIGEGMLCACETRDEAEQLIRDLKARLEDKGGDR